MNMSCINILMGLTSTEIISFRDHSHEPDAIAPIDKNQPNSWKSDWSFDSDFSFHNSTNVDLAPAGELFLDGKILPVGITQEFPTVCELVRRLKTSSIAEIIQIQDQPPSQKINAPPFSRIPLSVFLGDIDQETRHQRRRLIRSSSELGRSLSRRLSSGFPFLRRCLSNEGSFPERRKKSERPNSIGKYCNNPTSNEKKKKKMKKKKIAGVVGPSEENRGYQGVCDLSSFPRALGVPLLEIFWVSSICFSKRNG